MTLASNTTDEPAADETLRLTFDVWRLRGAQDLLTVLVVVLLIGGIGRAILPIASTEVAIFVTSGEVATERARLSRRLREHDTLRDELRARASDARSVEPWALEVRGMVPLRAHQVVRVGEGR